jgi:biofilm PGA synthesis N-glycosyltransferase PgaC
MTTSVRRVSVLIPVYNEENTVAAVVKKVLALGTLVKEVVNVDDGSTDGTAAVVERLANEEPLIRFFRLAKNQGKTAAIRRALFEATGEVIIIQDALSDEQRVRDGNRDHRHDLQGPCKDL